MSNMNEASENFIPSLLDSKPIFMHSSLAIRTEDVASPDGRGRRVVSRCGIAQGTILLVELPLVMSGTAAPSLRESVVDLCRNLGPFRDQIAVLEPRDSAWMRAVARDLDDCIELPLVSRAVNNCFKTKIGSGWHTTIYLHLSFFNHSCNPNASATLAHHASQEGTDTTTYKEHPRVIFAIQDIRAGDEVCIDYLGHQADLPRHMRQHHLLEGWGFNCQCRRCQNEASLDYCSTIAIPIGFVCASLPMLVAVNDDWEAVESALCEGDCWRELPGQRMLEELNELRGSIDEPLEEDPNALIVSYCILVGKALIQAAEGGHFELSMEDLQKLMSIMAQHVINLQVLLPTLHNSVVAMCSNLLEMQTAMADSDDEDDGALAREDLADNQGSHPHPVYAESSKVPFQVHRSIVSALKLSRIQWMEMAEQERQERLQVPFGSCAV